MTILRRLLALLRNAWRDAKCRTDQHMFDVAVLRGDDAASRYWQARKEHDAGWDE